MEIADATRVATLEAQRARLEENITKLKKSLQHWQQWSFEYDALKEELEDLSPEAPSSEVIAIGNDFEGDVLDQKEIDDLLGIDKKLTRTPRQVIALLCKRIDYVQRNVDTVRKQLDAAELQLADLDVVSSELPAGLPMTEITEQLDEEGNVTSSKLSRPGDATSELIGALKKAGVDEKDLLEDDVAEDEEEPTKGVPAPSPSPPLETTSAQSANDLPLAQFQHTTDKEIASSMEDTVQAQRKPVTIALDTKEDVTSMVEPHAVPQNPSLSPSRSGSAREKEAIKTQNNFDPKNRIIELGEDDEEIGSIAPKIPIEESEEDAAMRREMLAYSMNEMGSIVAQLDLDADAASVYTEEEVDEDDEDRTSATDDEDENEFGMSTKGVMDEEYRKEMEELEQRLNARYFENMGPKGAELLDQNEDVDVEQLATHTARIAVKEAENMPKRPPRSAAAPAPASSALKDTTAEKPKKGVRFSEDLDVAPASSPAAPPSAAAAIPIPTARKTATPGVRDTILERAPAHAAPAPPSTAEVTQPKVSRFKAARAAATSAPTSSTSIPAPPRVPTSRLTTPADSPLAPIVIERLPTTSATPSANTNTAPPSEPDELDPALLRKQVAEEYYRQRNKRISKQGGFKREAQEEEDMLDYEEEELEQEGEGKYGQIVEDEEDEEEERPKKMSLFRKARLKREGGW